jgi:DNA helicase-2/ATP-dependent DNA helicase PcrA
LLEAPLIRIPIPATSIETYERCPRQYFYQYGYQLYDDLSPYLRMHQTIRDRIQDLTQQTRDDNLPAHADDVRATTWQLFVDHQMEDVLYCNDYFAEVLRHVTQVWQDLRSGFYAPDAVDRRYIVRRPDGDIVVRVDRIEQGAHGPQWIRTRSGREREHDHLSTPIILYALAAQHEHGAEFTIALHYTATGTLRPATPKPQVLEAHVAKIDQLLVGIRHGQWDPNIGQHCTTCPFNLICPV